MTIAQTVPVPPFDPLGLPAPAWLFEFLMILTLLLHVLFMNFVLGGTVLASVLDALTLARRGNHNHTVRVIWHMMPVAISFTVTTGVAPLLFVQVLFGQFFYTANIFMGFTWLALFPLLIVAFYLTYILVYRLSSPLTRYRLSSRFTWWDHAPGRRLPLSLLAAVLVIAVGWILTNNHMLSIQPDQWAQEGRWLQGRLQVTPKTTHARFAHNFAGALAVAGLSLAAVGWWRRARQIDPPEVTERMIKTGLWVFLPLVLAAAIFGVTFLFLMPREVWTAMFTPTVYTVLWWVGLVAVVGQIAHGVLALQQPTQFRWFAGLAGSVLVGLVGMLAAREQVRLLYLGRDAAAFSRQVWDQNVHPQMYTFTLFVAALVAALAVVTWLLWISAKAAGRAAPAEERPA